MSYIRADEVLPKELIEMIQQYVKGQAIYIPCQEKKSWGSQSKAKQYYQKRNSEIYQKYREGMSGAHLASEYSLSEKSIQRIIRGQADSD